MCCRPWSVKVVGNDCVWTSWRKSGWVMDVVWTKVGERSVGNGCSVWTGWGKGVWVMDVVCGRRLGKGVGYGCGCGRRLEERMVVWMVCGRRLEEGVWKGVWVMDVVCGRRLEERSVGNGCGVWTKVGGQGVWVMVWCVDEGWGRSVVWVCVDEVAEVWEWCGVWRGWREACGNDQSLDVMQLVFVKEYKIEFFLILIKVVREMVQTFPCE
ncbi:hypothetical protein HNY73_020561 [Argiope bruennichi]|uniref:Uncharacterized protein n=1 Tax=Argiope bruennichi TaxID=94029 RepID=A0A8T0EBT4_ARGBR|nr:hypothetical protein HNY73_020561 [Argiope bruennichi]